jgi:hypothetical protein
MIRWLVDHQWVLFCLFLLYAYWDNRGWRQ